MPHTKNYGTLQDRVRHKYLLSKVMTAEETVQFFKPGMNLGWSGFTPAGYPKVVPIAVAEHVEKNNLQGKWKFNLFIGASVGAELSLIHISEPTRLGMISY